MKTTIEIADPLMRQARKKAEAEGTTLKALVDRGLRLVVAEKRTKKPFRLKLVTVKGEGLQPEFQNATWAEIRDAANRRGEE